MATAYGSSLISMLGSGSPVVLCCSPHPSCPSDGDRNKVNLSVLCVCLHLWFHSNEHVFFFFIVPAPIFNYPKNVLPSHSNSNSDLLSFYSPSLSGFCSSDSEGHFDTPEEATPVRSIPDFPGELEDSKDPDRTGKPDRNQNNSDGISIKHLFGFVLIF